VSKRLKWSGFWRVVGIVAALVFCLLPIVWTLVAALGLQPDGLRLQGKFTLDNLTGITTFEPAFVSEFAYTLAVSLAATALTIGAAFPAAFWLARTSSPGVAALMPTLLVLAVSPLIAYGLPLSNVEHAAGLYGSFAGLVLASAAVQLPLAVWLLRGYLLRIPRSLDEAAVLDGASGLTVLLRVVLPVALGGVIATGVLVFVLDWNLYLLPTLLISHPPEVLPVAMRDFFAFERDLEWPSAAAALIIAVAPAFLVVFIAQNALENLVFDPEG